MRRQETNEEGSWIRIFGRLRRTTITMKHRVPPPKPARKDEGARGEAPPLPTRRDAMPTSAGPTDPDVYNRRPLTPHPIPANLYEIPQESIPSLITPSAELIDEILDEIRRQSPGRDVVGDVRPTARNEAPPAYENLAYENVTPHGPVTPSTQRNHSPSGSEIDPSEYVRMAPGRPFTRAQPPTPPNSIRSAATQASSRQPGAGYDELHEAQPHRHSRGERLAPVPQGSPPLPRPRETPIPHYFRDYANPDVLPAYSLICMSTWYAQVSNDVIMCSECVTSEHSFCVRTGRQPTIWRHLHIISRTFEHTSLHCGRCYKLLLVTRRAIDCYQCRTYVIEMRDGIEHLVYKVLCETAIPHGL